MITKIKKKDLKEIYDSISTSCQWRKKIENLIMWSDCSSVEVDKTLIEQGYKEANSEQKKLIEKYFKIETPKNICEQITDINSVYSLLKQNRNLPYKSPKTKEEKCLNATYDFLNICKAYNKGWIANIKNDYQRKYYIYKYFSGCSFSWFVRYGCSSAHCSLGLHLEKEAYAKDIIKKFPNILDEYFMV